jgi:hypothetical protein
MMTQRRNHPNWPPRDTTLPFGNCRKSAIESHDTRPQPTIDSAQNRLGRASFPREFSQAVAEKRRFSSACFAVVALIAEWPLTMIEDRLLTWHPETTVHQ